MFNHKKRNVCIFQSIINIPKVFLNLHLLRWVTKYNLKYLGTATFQNAFEDTSF